jgi:hypothetical protein
LNYNLAVIFNLDRPSRSEMDKILEGGGY